MNTYELDATDQMPPTDDEMNAMYEEYERREFNVTCKHCGLKAMATQSALDKAGWSLTRKGEICQSCIQWDAAIALGRAQKLNDSLPPVTMSKRKLAAIPCPF